MITCFKTEEEVYQTLCEHRRVYFELLSDEIFMVKFLKNLRQKKVIILPWPKSKLFSECSEAEIAIGYQQGKIVYFFSLEDQESFKKMMQTLFFRKKKKQVNSFKSFESLLPRISSKEQE